MRAPLSLCLLLLACTAERTSRSGRPEPGSVAQNSNQRQERIRRVEEGLLPSHGKGQPTSPMKLAERMRFFEVPGVSIAVIDDGRVEWARGHGVLEAGKGDPVSADALFQACSLSKPIAAMAALYLVERGQLDLDEDVNRKLVTWKVPDNELTRQQKVTLRRLLSHTAGLTVSGLPGYAFGEDVPTLPQILDGKKPANSEPVQVDTVPGTAWRYSGGGYLVLQQLMIDVSGRPFADLMREVVLERLGMKHSTFQQSLPPSLRRQTARGHHEHGTVVKGGWHRYPEMAVAGLWTTPSDLAVLAIELQKARAGRSNKVLSRRMANEMFSGQMRDFPVAMVSERYGRLITNQGLGFRLEGAGRAARFSHHGGNVGYTCFIVVYLDRGQGAVVMTNSDNGRELIQEIVRSIAKEYGWPEYPLTAE